MGLIEHVKDRWLTWRTGYTREERLFRAWYDDTVNWRASDITDMFKNFQHVIDVDWNKFITDGGMGCPVPVPDARQYFWPRRPLETTCVWRIERVTWNESDHRWHLTEIGADCDKVFVATNSDADAVMIKLRWT